MIVTVPRVKTDMHDYAYATDRPTSGNAASRAVVRCVFPPRRHLVLGVLTRAVTWRRGRGSPAYWGAILVGQPAVGAEGSTLVATNAAPLSRRDAVTELTEGPGADARSVAAVVERAASSRARLGDPAGVAPVP